MIQYYYRTFKDKTAKFGMMFVSDKKKKSIKDRYMADSNLLQDTLKERFAKQEARRKQMLEEKKVAKGAEMKRLRTLVAERDEAAKARIEQQAEAKRAQKNAMNRQMAAEDARQRAERRGIYDRQAIALIEKYTKEQVDAVLPDPVTAEEKVKKLEDKLREIEVQVAMDVYLIPQGEWLIGRGWGWWLRTRMNIIE